MSIFSYLFVRSMNHRTIRSTGALVVMPFPGRFQQSLFRTASCDSVLQHHFIDITRSGVVTHQGSSGELVVVKTNQIDPSVHQPSGRQLFTCFLPPGDVDKVITDDALFQEYGFMLCHEAAIIDRFFPESREVPKGTDLVLDENPFHPASGDRFFSDSVSGSWHSIFCLRSFRRKLIFSGLNFSSADIDNILTSDRAAWNDSVSFFLPNVR